MNKIVNHEKDVNKKIVNNEIFMDHFRYFNTSFLEKDLYEPNQAKNKELASWLNDSSIDLKCDVNKKSS